MPLLLLRLAVGTQNTNSVAVAVQCIYPGIMGIQCIYYTIEPQGPRVVQVRYKLTGYADTGRARSAIAAVYIQAGYLKLAYTYKPQTITTRIGPRQRQRIEPRPRERPLKTKGAPGYTL